MPPTARVEEILLDTASRHTVTVSEMSEAASAEMQRRYLVKPASMKPQGLLPHG